MSYLTNIKNVESPSKIGLSILLFLCLLDLPYGFYQIVRVISMVLFVIYAFTEYQEGKVEIAIIFIGLAILFQPIIKVPLGRTIWNIVDVIVGFWLIYQSKKR